jgi:hypothetical protein
MIFSWMSVGIDRRRKCETGEMAGGLELDLDPIRRGGLPWPLGVA